MYTEEEGGGIQADVQELAPIWTFLEGTLKGEGERERERVPEMQNSKLCK